MAPLMAGSAHNNCAARSPGRTGAGQMV